MGKKDPKLTKEELDEENARIKQEAKKTQSKLSKRIVKLLAAKMWPYYILIVLLPPIGFYVLWKNKDKLELESSSVAAWAIPAVVLTFAYIKMIVEAVM